MATLIFIGAMGFAALIDVIMAVAIMHTIALFFGLSLLWYHYFVIAPVIGTFPDFDALLQLCLEGKIDDDHHHGSPSRELFCTLRMKYHAIMAVLIFIYAIVAAIFHKPLLMAVAGFLGGTFFFGYPWGVVVMLSWLAHHLHDSCCLDFGLKWLWPFSNNNYHFGGRMPLGKKELAHFRLVHVYTSEELEKLKDQFIDVQTWLKLIYYKPTLYSVLELVISAALLFFVTFSFHSEIAAFVWMLMMAGVVVFWTLAKKYAL